MGSKLLYLTPVLSIMVLVSITSAAAVALFLIQQPPLSYSVSQSSTTGVILKPSDIVTSGDNVYIAWWSNKTGNDEVMFRASTDNGFSFSAKVNLSNTSNADSNDVNVVGEEDNVYVTWWERNATINEPVLRISTNDGETFGPTLMLASNGTLGGTLE
jgi:hypothetical protein